MTVSYLDTLATVAAANAEGVAYDSLTRAMRVHVRSLVAEGHVAGFVGDEAVTLDTKGVVICLTEGGVAYVAMFTEAGLMQPREALVEHAATKRKPKAARRGKGKATAAVVPSPTESVVSPVLPKGTTARRVPGGSQDQLAIVKDEDMSEMDVLRAQVNMLMDVLLQHV